MALNIIILLCCGLLLFYIIGLGRIICPPTSSISQGEIDAHNKVNNKPYVGLYGSYYKMGDIVNNHVNDNQYLNQDAMESTVLGQDVSPMFFKVDSWSKYCPGIPQPAQGFDNIKRDVPEKATTVWHFHRDKDKSGIARD